MWDTGAEGVFSFSIANGKDSLPAGQYALKASVGGVDLQSGSATIGAPQSNKSAPPRQTSQGVTISGYLVDADTGKPIANGLVGILKPGVTVAQFAKQQLETQVAAFGRSDKDGYFRLSPQLQRGSTYGAIVVADGYQPIAEDDALVLTADEPDEVELDPVALVRK